MKILSRMMHVPLLFLLVYITPSCATLDQVDMEHVAAKLLRMLEMRFCYISFVTVSPDDDEYLIKQKKSNCFRKIVSVVRDAITAHIAKKFGIAHHVRIAHEVRIIPAGKDFPGKPRADWPATIHTIAPGKMIKAQNTSYTRMNIKQAKIGFRRDMLQWMAKHPVLLIIVAMDTFLCNHDRHRGNLFYDAKHDSFCAIDMDSAFKYNLCALACKNFTAMLNDRSLRLSSKEVKTLTLYKEYLEFLIDTYHPEDTIAKYNEFAQQAGFVEGSPLYTQKIALELERNRRMIMESYEDAKKLVIIVGQLIKKGRKRLKTMM
ncbi:MAG TPA: hypothetical protein VJJ26_03405 [Candidatus Babeliales bacterium]|nr:hypothetical protein [Candidatus Babeliales bacterium]